MVEQNRGNIVEELNVKRSTEILNDQHKMAILNLLKKEGSASFGDIIRKLGISQSAGTNHILELKLLGLIDKSADPPNYNLNDERFAALMSQKRAED